MKTITNAQIDTVAKGNPDGLRKGIAYAYPSSEVAKSLGCDRTGCYYVYARKSLFMNAFAAAIAFRTLDQAREHIAQSGWLHMLPNCNYSM